MSSGSLSCFALIELSSYIAQAGLKLLNSRKPPSSASQITDNRRPAPRRLGPGGELEGGAEEGTGYTGQDGDSNH